MPFGFCTIQCDRRHLHRGVPDWLAVSIEDAHERVVRASFQLPVGEDEFDSIAVHGRV
jgi:hypothetical protein